VVFSRGKLQIFMRPQHEATAIVKRSNSRENEMTATIPEESTVLSSWKDIARYMGKGVRTVQGWERHLGLPVRRPTGAAHKSAVLLDRSDVDAWMATRFSLRARQKDETAQMDLPSGSARSNLREGIRTARELRRANHALAEQISQSIRLLTERCDLLTTHSLQVPWCLTASAATESLPNSVSGVSE
jgi:DNA-binding transcriptional regulator YiaG